MKRDDSNNVRVIVFFIVFSLGEAIYSTFWMCILNAIENLLFLIFLTIGNILFKMGLPIKSHKLNATILISGFGLIIS